VTQLFTMLKDEIPPTNQLLAVLCLEFGLKAATFDGCYFYNKETGNQLALGSVKAWVDASHIEEVDLPLFFGALDVYCKTLSALLVDIESSQ
jgi:hypothetical protein